jgi:hypothetical protein
MRVVDYAYTPSLLRQKLVALSMYAIILLFLQSSVTSTDTQERSDVLNHKEVTYVFETVTFRAFHRGV